jgi:hypothetical protein
VARGCLYAVLPGSFDDLSGIFAGPGWLQESISDILGYGMGDDAEF